LIASLESEANYQFAITNFQLFCPSLLRRNGRVGGLSLQLRLLGTGGSLRPPLSLLLAFLEFGKLLLTLLESIVALGHMAFRHGDEGPGG